MNGISSAKNGSNIDLPKKVAVIFSDVKKKYFPTKEQYISEEKSFRYATTISHYLEKMGMKTILLPGNGSLAFKLKKHKPDVALNLVGSIKGIEFLAASIPGILELLEIPYTGAGILGESLSYNKFLVKKLLEQNGIPIPHYQLFNSSKDPIISNLRYPLISKLNEIHGSVELDINCISENEKHLRERIRYLIKTYKQPVLVEEYIVGTEIVAVLLEGLNKKVYLGESIIDRPTGKYKFQSFELKWLVNGPVINFQKYNDSILKEYVKKAFSVCDMNDYGKFDIIIDSSGRYYFIDSNSNPELGPLETESPVTMIMNLYDVSFSELMKKILVNSVRGYTGKKKLPILY